jgi:hypothetical protein
MRPNRSNQAALLGWIAVLLLAVGLNASADAGKNGALQQALEDTRRAEQSVRARIALAETIRSRVRQEGDLLKTEIRDEQRRLGLLTYPTAVRIKRIDNNLRLLQRLEGYTGQLELRQAELRAILGCFERYRERIRDEVRMVRTLDDADTGDLLRELSAVVQDVYARCDKPLITAPGPEPSAERIWADILQGR